MWQNLKPRKEKKMQVERENISVQSSDGIYTPERVLFNKEIIIKTEAIVQKLCTDV